MKPAEMMDFEKALERDLHSITRANRVGTIVIAFVVASLFTLSLYFLYNHYYP